MYIRSDLSFICGLPWFDIMQVEVPGGRGKPSILVDKDESLEKVSQLMLMDIYFLYFHVIPLFEDGA